MGVLDPWAQKTWCIHLCILNTEPKSWSIISKIESLWSRPARCLLSSFCLCDIEALKLLSDIMILWLCPDHLSLSSQNEIPETSGGLVPWLYLVSTVRFLRILSGATRHRLTSEDNYLKCKIKSHKCNFEGGKKQTHKIRNDREDSTTNFTEIEGVIREFCVQLYAN